MKISIVIILALTTKPVTRPFLDQVATHVLLLSSSFTLVGGSTAVKGETDVSLLDEPLRSVTTVIVGLISL